MDNRPIGVFDSGVGGLTVIDQLMKQLPQEQLVYFGDTARVPYGSKSKETVTKFSKQIIRFLLSQDVKAILVACNTACSNSLEELQKSFSIPIFGVVAPGVQGAVETTRNQQIGIIGTASTVASRAYEILLKQYLPEASVIAKACPLFVPLAEEGWTQNEVAYKTAAIYLNPLVEEKIDTLILGCTHYPLLRSCIEDTIGGNIQCVDPAETTALIVKKYLKDNHMLREGPKPRHVFYVSDNTGKFDEMCERTLHTCFEAHLIDIEKY